MTKELKIEEFFVTKEKIQEIPGFIANKIERILLIANTISLLKIADLEHYNCCYHENFKFKLFFEFGKISSYEGMINKIFDEKQEELAKLFRKFEVFK